MFTKIILAPNGPDGCLAAVPLREIARRYGEARPSAAKGSFGSGPVTGTLPPLPGDALSSAQPASNIAITTAATATTKMTKRARLVGTGMDSTRV